MGKWWEKPKEGAVEIDIVALKESGSSMLFAECKWQDKKPTIADIESLHGKAEHVDWRKGSRSEKFAFFSKSGFDEKTRHYAKENSWLLVDLKELETAFQQSSS